MTMASRSTYRAYPEYKASGVGWLGEIPAHWEVVRLRFLLTSNPSKRVVTLYEEELVSFVPMEAVGEYGGLDLEIKKPLGDVGSGYTYFADDDVVVAKITPCFENGKGALASGLMNGVGFGTTELHVLRSNGELDRVFLFCLTISHAFRKLGEAEMYGAGGQKRVPENFIRDLRVGIPPLPEQRAIARFLDHKTAQIDALIAKKEALLARLADKRTALISHAVTKGLDPDAPMKDSGIAWLGEIPAHWEVVQLRHFGGLVQTGPFGSQLHSHEYVDDGYPVVNPANILDGRIIPSAKMTIDEETRQRLSRHVLQKGDIVLGRRGELGRAAYIDDREAGWLCGTGSILIRIVHPALRTDFLSQYLLLHAIKEYLTVESVGSTMDNLNTDIINRIPVVLPPIDEQEQIVTHCEARVRHSVTQIGKIEAAIARLKDYRTALITHAVTGKIDVRTVPVPESPHA